MQPRLPGWSRNWWRMHLHAGIRRFGKRVLNVIWQSNVVHATRFFHDVHRQVSINQSQKRYAEAFAKMKDESAALWSRHSAQMNTFEISAQSILGLMELGHRKRVLVQDQMYTFQMCVGWWPVFVSSMLYFSPHCPISWCAFMGELPKDSDGFICVHRSFSWMWWWLIFFHLV